jgi:hypothetical protein
MPAHSDAQRTSQLPDFPTFVAELLTALELAHPVVPPTRATRLVEDLELDSLGMFQASLCVDAVTGELPVFEAEAIPATLGELYDVCVRSRSDG